MMNMKIPKKTIFALALLICISGMTMLAQAAIVSPALDLIAAEYGLIKVNKVSHDVYFDSSDFTDVTGLDNISGITVVGLPEESTGVLMLGNIAVAKDQTISKRHLSSLRFVPVGIDESVACFEFVTNENTSGIYSCFIYLLDREERAPIARGDTSLSTYTGMSISSTMKAADPDGDPIIFKVTALPTNGSLCVTDASVGSYRYTPSDGFAGVDSFEYTATDLYGSSSAPVSVYINVKEPESELVFADLDGHWAHYGAIRAAACGAMSYVKQSDGTYTFSPDAPVSRAEFCAALMKNAGYDGFTAVGGTGFADDEDIPDEYKGCIAAASVLGVAKGAYDADEVRFYPNNKITRAEAAVMAERLYGFGYENDGAVAVFSDIDTVPAWARESVNALASLGILNGSPDGSISPYSVLTRAEVAVMLSNIKDLGI